jgi:long-chain acyl-CoA synthetase
MPEMFTQTAARHGDASLIDFLGRKFSFSEVQDGADRVACGLAGLGIRQGDRVGLFLPNVPHYVAAYFGALKLGATVVNFSPLYSVEELAHQVEDSGTRILFTMSASALLPTAMHVMEQTRLERLVIGSIAGALPSSKSILYRLTQAKQITPFPDDPSCVHFSKLISNDGGCRLAPIDPEKDVALIQYSGGTTGTPKGAILTHQNLTANARQMQAVDGRSAGGDRIMGALPFFHIFANATIINRSVLAGDEIVMLPRFDAGQTLAAIARAKVTLLPAVPTMFQALLDHPKLVETDLSSIRQCTSGGAPMSAELKAKFETATGARISEGYGLTEGGIVSVNPYQDLNKVGSIGQPLPGTLVTLVDRDDATKPAPPGEPGEITVSGPQVMRGYWNRPDTADATFVNGALRTGDVGVIDEDGYIRIVDRMKDMISVGGFKVFPGQVEQVLYRHPAVKEALVIGVAEAYRGEVPKAFVTLNQGQQVTGEELMAWLNPQLGKHERVIAVVVRDSLPKTLVGKLSRKMLIEDEAART